jgi:hypothetical protein
MNNPPPNQDNPIFVNQPTATRVVRMSNPAPQNNATQQAYYVNKSNDSSSFSDCMFALAFIELT